MNVDIREERRFGGLPLFVGLGLVALACGALMPMYVDAVGTSAMKLAAVPAALALVFLLFMSRVSLLFAIVVFRASGDIFLDSSKFGVGGAQIGIGGLINAFVIVIAVLLLAEKSKPLARSVFRSWGPFLVVALVGVAMTPDRGAAIRLYLQQLSTFSMFICGWCVVNSFDQFKRSVKLIIASSAVPVALGAFQFVTGTGSMSPDAGMRVQSTFSHPNIFGFYLVLVISLTLYALKSEAFRKTAAVKAGLVLYLFLLLVVLAATKARSSWVACFAMFLLYGLFFERRFLIYLVVGGALALFLPGVQDRVVDIIQGPPKVVTTYTELNSFEWRETLWKSALSWMSPTRYLTGYGLEAFPYYSTTFFRDSDNVNWGAHNDYVQIFFELGVIGTIAFLWMYGQALIVLRRMLKLDRLAAFLLMALVVEYLVVCASDNMMQYLSFNWYLWFALGAGLGAVGVVAREPATAPGPEQAAA